MPTEELDAAQEAATETTSTTEPSAAESTPSPYDGLPDGFQWLVKELETTRREAAAARVAAREQAERYKDAKTPEEFETLRTELVARAEAAERAAVITATVTKHGLTDELAEFLTGATPEEIEAQAAKLAALAVPAATTPVTTRLPPSGGTNPAEGAGDVNGREAYRAWKKRR